MNDIKCREIRCGTALELITCIDWSTDFACKENMPYDKLEPAVGRSFRMDGSSIHIVYQGDADDNAEHGQICDKSKRHDCVPAS